MGLRDRLEAGLEAGRSRLTSPVDRFRGLHAIFTEDEEPQSIPTFILKLVRAVRMEDGSDDEEETAREVYVQAKQRRRRLGLVSFTTGPLVPVATELTDLYCETATVCDLIDLHGLQQTDEEVGAHMLVLWSLAEDMEDARIAIGDPSGTAMGALIYARLGLADQEPAQSKKDLIKRIWQVQSQLGDFKENLGTGAVKGVMFTGRRTKKFIKEAEAQLGVTS
jgi:hypothetical protein